MSRHLSGRDRERAIMLLRDGFSQRKVCEYTGLHRETIKKVFDSIDEVDCPCGKKASHKGYCAARRRINA